MSWLVLPSGVARSPLGSTAICGTTPKEDVCTPPMVELNEEVTIKPSSVTARRSPKTEPEEASISPALAGSGGAVGFTSRNFVAPGVVMANLAFKTTTVGNARNPTKALAHGCFGALTLAAAPNAG